MRYRKKPVIVEAKQWHAHGDHPSVRRTSYTEVAQGLGTSGCSRGPECWSWAVMGVIDTLEGPHFVIPGDWIITGVRGEHYACKAEIFAATYDEVSE